MERREKGCEASSEKGGLVEEVNREGRLWGRCEDWSGRGFCRAGADDWLASGGRVIGGDCYRLASWPILYSVRLFDRMRSSTASVLAWNSRLRDP